jgi:DNA-binding MarR family transcriptional regulator
MGRKKKFYLQKLLILVLAIAMSFSVGCTKSEQKVQSSSNKTEAPKPKSLNSKEIVAKFKESGIPIGKIIEYTAETDSNKLLGRPNQYVEKVNWADSRIEQISADDVTGGTIEIFANELDCKKRKEYIEQVTSGNAMFAQYIFQKKNVLLRLEYDLTPEQADQYKSVFNKVVQ